MLEENRLQPMVEGYDEKMFNRLYSKTYQLRKKLASQIDSRRFGLQFEDVLSFFDIKFIFVFNKYCTQHNEEVLLGHLINSLSFFKNRILRSAYTKQYSQSIISTDEVLCFEETMSEYQLMDSEKNHYYNILMNFMRKNLSQNAYAVLEIQLNPPPYILDKLNIDIDSKLHKIPDQLILDYFDLGYSNKAYKFLNDIIKEIHSATNYAKAHFNKN